MSEIGSGHGSLNRHRPGDGAPPRRRRVAGLRRCAARAGRELPARSRLRAAGAADARRDRPGQIAAARADVAGAVGGAGLNGLVNKAGISAGGAIELLEIDDLRRTLEINVVGQVAVTKAFLPMIRAVRGRVVLVGSINGRLTTPFLGPYGASKHALEAIGDSLRGEMRLFGVEVAIIEPGAVRTEIWQKSREDADEAMAAMDTEQRALYGEATAGFVAAALKGGERAAGPEKVAKAIEHALTAQRPHTRYLVGADARIQALVRRLPDRLRDRLIARLIRG